MGDLQAANGTLNERERRFVFAILNGKKKTDALISSGYTENCAFAVLSNTKITTAIARLGLTRLHSEYAPQALRFIGELVTDEKAPMNTRLKAAETILKTAGYDDRQRAAAYGVEMDRDFEAMPLNKLESLILEMEKQLNASKPGRAQPDAQVVDVEPVETPESVMKSVLS